LNLEKVLLETKEKGKFFKKIKNKYRLVILNDSSFEEKFSFLLTPLNLFLLAFSSAILLIVLVSVIIVYTPLRESIPGYTDVSIREDLTKMVLKSDSLENELNQNQKHLNNLTAILKGEEPQSISSDSIISPSSSNSNPNQKSYADSLLRDYVEREESFSLDPENDGKNNRSTQILFFTPLAGTVTNKFDPAKEHFGIDIVAPKDEAIKATLDGTVIFAEWTVETGYVIQLQHSNNLTSIYKHNSILLKRTGEVVKAGEAIAIVGNSGKLTTGPHLHFEIWKDGIPENPITLINFE
jgi:murein DD-endopeptidase MepM/ murein hydrolase activator NlpD